MESESAKTLAGINILDGLDEAVLRRLESRCRWRRVTPGQRLIDFGAESREVFFIIDTSRPTAGRLPSPRSRPETSSAKSRRSTAVPARPASWRSRLR
jgi:hypothetical protein